MDLYCSKCGEPWDNDCLHDEVSERNDFSTAKDDGTPWTYRDVLREFQQSGCIALSAAFGAGVGDDCAANRGNSARAAAADALNDLLGDDSDGIASMMQDAEDMGLFR